MSAYMSKMRVKLLLLAFLRHARRAPQRAGMVRRADNCLGPAHDAREITPGVDHLARLQIDQIELARLDRVTKGRAHGLTNAQGFGIGIEGVRAARCVIDLGEGDAVKRVGLLYGLNLRVERFAAAAPVRIAENGQDFGVLNGCGYGSAFGGGDSGLAAG